MFALIDYNLVCIPFIYFLPSLDRVNKSMFLSASLNEETRTWILLLYHQDLPMFQLIQPYFKSFHN